MDNDNRLQPEAHLSEQQMDWGISFFDLIKRTCVMSSESSVLHGGCGMISTVLVQFQLAHGLSIYQGMGSVQSPSQNGLGIFVTKM